MPCYCRRALVPMSDEPRCARGHALFYGRYYGARYRRGANAFPARPRYMISRSRRHWRRRRLPPRARSGQYDAVAANKKTFDARVLKRHCRRFQGTGIRAAGESLPRYRCPIFALPDDGCMLRDVVNRDTRKKPRCKKRLDYAGLSFVGCCLSSFYLCRRQAPAPPRRASRRRRLASRKIKD